MPLTIVITGATDGLGKGVAETLAAQGHDLILHGRTQAKVDAVAGPLGARTVVGDLGELAQVHDIATQVAALTDHVDVFLSNAGIGAVDNDGGYERQVSADGHELRFAVNFLAGFDLTLRLLPLIRAAEAGRIVNVASAGQAAIDFDDVMLERDYQGWHAYRQSKLAQVTSGFALAGRLPPRTVTVNSLHPGSLMPTKMVVASNMAFIDTLESGVQAVTRLAVADDVAKVTGRYFDRLEDTRADPSAYDREVQERLWSLALELTGAPDVA
jgi:NAD(P)-dependent dehydrogenase (short-subunit alcohol dehydrogenase family)